MEGTTRLRAVALAALAAVGGCASDAGSAEDDGRRIRGDVARRTGVEVPAPARLAVDGAWPAVDAATRAILSEPLTEKAAVQVALLRNPSVRASYERLGIARADLLQAGLVRNPVFTADAKFFDAGGPELELSLAQSFVDLFFRPLRRRVAAAELCAAQAEVARDLVGLVFDVRRALVAARAAQDVVEARAKAHAAAAASRDLMRRLHEAGNVVDAKMTLEEVAASRAALDLAAAEASVREAREPVHVLLGLAGDATAWTVAGRLPTLPGDAPTPAEAEARALPASLDLVASRARVEAALRRAGLVRDESAWETFDLGLVAKREAADGAWGAGPSVSTSIPLFDAGQARSAAALATARGLVARHEAIANDVRSAARRLADRAGTLRDRERALRETYLPLRARLVVETLQSYNAMQIGAFDVLRAKELERDAEREHVETLRDAWLARLDLQELLAGALPRARAEASGTPEAASGPSEAKGH
jgi:cobalt-zinc-cadmium efflux system outer membrane protein